MSVKAAHVTINRLKIESVFEIILYWQTNRAAFSHRREKRMVTGTIAQMISLCIACIGLGAIIGFALGIRERRDDK